MPKPDGPKQRSLLQEIARRAMVERGLEPDFSPAASGELDAIHGPAVKTAASVRDLRDLLWCSIDNDDSRDLDQLTVAEPLAGGLVTLRVAVAEVGALVRSGSALDGHARKNTTSVYTAGGIFPMLPEKLSTDLTSLGFGADRIAIVIEMVFGPDGAMRESSLGEALVRNRAKLAYNSVAAWLDGAGPMPQAIAAVPGLAENLQAQHRMAQVLRARRHRRGALSLQTLQPRAVFSGEILQDLKPDESNVAKNLIEELMVASNGVTAQFLEARRLPSMRRIVRTPAKWDRIAELASQHGTTLPKEPDGKALEAFLLSRMNADPVHFPDLSLCIIKLLGRGEYVIEFPGDEVPGHFGLAVKEYAHSTAPNRRFPDLIIQRLLKAALAGSPPPYGGPELVELAQHCTDQEDAAKKVERQVIKSAAALLLAPRVGATFDAMVTGVTDTATWVRIFHPPVEGKLGQGGAELNVGDRLRVRLVHTDVERGYIDFVRAG
jgi:VacB/RNase II family 3'-5' exoribonuclease